MKKKHVDGSNLEAIRKQIFLRFSFIYLKNAVPIFTDFHIPTNRLNMENDL